jgi:hypothetical protein
MTMNMVEAINAGTPGIGSHVQNVIDRCNSAFPNLPANNSGAGQLELTVHAGFSAGRWTGSKFVAWGWWFPSGASGRPAIAHTTFRANIVCRGKPEELQSAAKRLDAGMVVEQFGDTCPKKTEVRLYVEYDKETKARLRVTRNGKGSFLHTRIVKTKPVNVGGKTVHRAKHTFTFHLDPGLHRFRGEVREHGQWKKVASRWVKSTCPPFEVISAWLKFDVEDKATCPKKVVETATFKATRPGMVDYEIKHQGGLVIKSGQIKAERKGLEYVAMHTRQFVMTEPFQADFMADVKNSPANSGWVTLKIECLEVLSGTLDLRDPDGQACPRKGEVAFSIRTNMPGPVSYRLECTGNRLWEGTVDAVQTGPDTFLGVGVKGFMLHQAEQVTCGLRSTEPPKVLALQGRKYACVKRTQEPVTGDLAPPPRPTVPAPVPTKIVEPPRPAPTASMPSVVGTVKPISCAGGRVLRGQCVCPFRTKKVQAGTNAWRCLKEVKPFTTTTPSVRPIRPVVPNATVRPVKPRPQAGAASSVRKRVSDGARRTVR